MPTRKRISVETFEKLRAYASEHGGKILGDKEKMDIYDSIGLVPPKRKKKNDGEVGFLFWVKGLLVYAWTSFVMKTMEDNWEDHGWVLIVCKESKTKYFATPIRRTENFERNLIQSMEIALAHAHGRPLCKTCKRFMVIHKKYHKKSQTISIMWACFNGKVHERPKFENWDIGLSTEQQAITDNLRKKRKTYRDSNDAKGIKRKPARTIRKRWTVIRPDNQV